MKKHMSIKSTSSRFVVAEKLCEEVSPVFAKKFGREFKRGDLNKLSTHAIANPDEHKDTIVRYGCQNYYNPRKIQNIIESDEFKKYDRPIPNETDTRRRVNESKFGVDPSRIVPIQLEGEKKPSEIYVDIEPTNKKSTGDDSVIVDIELQVVDRFFIVVPKEIRIGQDVLNYLEETGFDGIDFVSGMESPKMIIVSGDQIVIDVNTTVETEMSSTVVECKTAEEAQKKRRLFVDIINSLYAAVTTFKNKLNFADGAVRNVDYEGSPTVALMRIPQLVPGCFINDIVIVDPKNYQRLLCVSEDEIGVGDKLGGIITDSTIIFHA
jgi:hypothetical protein